MARTKLTPAQINPTPQSAAVGTSETTTSTTYADLTTTTDSVTITIGANGSVWISLYAQMFDSITNAFAWVSFAASGANTIAASDTMALMFQNSQASVAVAFGSPFVLTGLNPGSTTFKMKYRVQTGGGGAGTGTFSNRRITAVAL